MRVWTRLVEELEVLRPDEHVDFVAPSAGRDRFQQHPESRCLQYIRECGVGQWRIQCGGGVALRIEVGHQCPGSPAERSRGDTQSDRRFADASLEAQYGDRVHAWT